MLTPKNLFWIDWFHFWNLWENTFFCISDEVIKWSNASFPSSYVREIFNLFIRKKLEKNWVNVDKLLNDCIIVIAHWKSDKNSWKIFWKKEDNKWIDMEEFLSKLPKEKKVLLYVCNTWWYKLNEWEYKIIYPKTNTWVENLEFHISEELYKTFNY